MNAARLENSPRLQRVLAFLRKQGDAGATTREIVQGAHAMAVNSSIAELRSNGFIIDCQMEGRGRFRYTLREGHNDSARLAGPDVDLLVPPSATDSGVGA